MHVTTLTLTFLGNDYSVKYVSIEYSKRAGRSKFHWFRDTSRYLAQVVRMSTLFRPLKVFMPPALLVLGSGLVKSLFDFALRGRAATSTMLLLVVSIGLGVVGLLADLMVQLSKDHNVVDPAHFQSVIGE